MKRFLGIEWEAIAGIIAAVAAILLHFLHVVEIIVLLTISVVLIAVLFIRSLRWERVIERMEGSLGRSEAALGELPRKLLELEAKIEHVGSGASAGVLVGHNHDEGNRQLIQMLRPFSEQRLDLLQFSGYAAGNLMREVAQKYPGTTIRLLIASKTITDCYDKPPFHEDNVKTTYQNLRVIQQQQPNVTFAVWRYQVHPVISGILAGSRLVSASWYRVYPVANQELPFLRGQDQPTVTATGEAAPAILRMVQEQFNSILYHSTTELIVASGPKATEVVGSWVSMITQHLSTDQKRAVSDEATGKIKSIPKAGELLSW